MHLYCILISRPENGGLDRTTSSVEIDILFRYENPVRTIHSIPSFLLEQLFQNQAAVDRISNHFRFSLPRNHASKTRFGTRSPWGVVLVVLDTNTIITTKQRSIRPRFSRVEKMIRSMEQERHVHHGRPPLRPPLSSYLQLCRTNRPRGYGRSEAKNVAAVVAKIASE